MRTRVLVSLAVAGLVTSSVLHAQSAASIPSLVMNCTNGNAAFDSTDAQAARAALEELRWRTSYETYVAIQGKRGAVTAFDTIAVRGDRLIAFVRAGGSASLDPVVDSLRARLRVAREAIQQHLRADGTALAPSRVVDATPFVLASGRGAGEVRLGLSPAFVITTENRTVAVAICATANLASEFIRHLDDPARSDLAKRYIAADTHWDLFVKGGYSMTMWERLAASCRLGFLGKTLALVRSCDPALRGLEPPSLQAVMVHPVAGLAPVFRHDSTYRDLVVVEWYGVLRHWYTDKEIRTTGLSVASGYPQTGRALIGGVLHTPWGSAAVLGGKSAKPLYVLTADAMGWIAGVRTKMQALKPDKSAVLARLLGIDGH